MGVNCCNERAQKVCLQKSLCAGPGRFLVLRRPVFILHFMNHLSVYLINDLATLLKALERHQANRARLRS